MRQQIIEHLTDKIERLAAEYIEKIDAMGGMLAAIEAGYPQREIERAAYDYQKAVETGEGIVVGVNRFQIKNAEDELICQAEQTKCGGTDGKNLLERIPVCSTIHPRN